VAVIETAARGAQFILAIGIAYIVALWFALVAWTFRDIESRSRSVFTQVFSTLMVVLFFVPGLLLYLILRPKETLDQAFQRALEEEYLLQDLDDLPLCPGCQRTVESEFVLCPNCQTRLRGPCPSCARLIDLRWSVCPYCAVPVDVNAIEGPRIGIDSLRVHDTSREGRRKRAVAAAAQRVGIEPDELDAFTDALSGSGSTAIGSSGALSRRVSAIGAPSFAWANVRDRITSFGGNAGATEEESGDGASEDSRNEGRQVDGTRFWADPLPRSARERDNGQGT
jgi:RNA polymerase subunit RPABC4/transcription elongation factor Spt4